MGLVLLGSPPLVAQVDPAVRYQQQLDALNRGDVAGAVALFSADAVLQGVGLCIPGCFGTAAIQREVERQVADRLRLTRTSTRTFRQVVLGQLEGQADSVQAAGAERIRLSFLALLRGEQFFLLRLTPDLTDPQTATYVASFQSPGAPPLPRPAGLLGALVVADTFDGAPGPLQNHRPGVAPPRAAWEIESGQWDLVQAQVRERSAVPADTRAVIDTGLTAKVLAADLTWVAGRMGLVLRYVNPGNWVMIWYDGFGTLVSAMLTAQGGFVELAREPWDWGAPGTPRHWEVQDFGDRFQVSIDRQVRAVIPTAAAAQCTRAGLFNREGPENRFDNFQVRPLLPGSVPALSQVALPPVPESIPQFRPLGDGRTPGPVSRYHAMRNGATGSRQ
ncbi:MAG: hypothetical protein HY335_05475 [Deinococcus sp.]|nr:hypothetical protein [Deinococcus sp.]